MLNRKNVCTCKDNNYNSTSTSSFYLFQTFNNKYAPVNINSRTDTVTNKSGYLNTTRVGNDSCATPWRTPLNHYRKTYSCDSTCLTNEKIVKNVNTDSSDSECGCRRNYASTRLVNKVGIRLIQSNSNANYLQSRRKNYHYHAQGILNENKIGVNEYKIRDVDGTKFNLNSNTLTNADCSIKYITAISTTESKFQYANSYRTIKQDLNPYYGKCGATSQRNRINKLKYDSINGAATTVRDGYNNCVNGSEASRYGNPGPNTKKFTTNKFTSPKIFCKPRRLAGMRQSCS